MRPRPVDDLDQQAPAADTSLERPGAVSSAGADALS